MPRYAYVNGSYLPHKDAGVHIEDRGFQFADSVYEVIALIHGQLVDEGGHLDRLERSLAAIDIAMPVKRDNLRFIIRELLRKNRLRNGMIYMQVSRGACRRDFPFPAAHVPPTLVITTRPYRYEVNPRLEKGISVITTPDIRWHRRDIKTNGLLAQILAKQKALDSGAYDAWFFDDDGYVTEGSASNAWILTDDGCLVTRQPTEKILRGVTRAALFHICKDLGLVIEERPFTVEEAYNAREAFSTGAIALTVPVIEIDGRKIGDGQPGPVVKKLYDAYRDYVARGETVNWKAD